MNTLSFILLYLDPGTGSLIIQLIIAGVTTAFFFIKSVREKISNIIKSLRTKKQKE